MKNKILVAVAFMYLLVLSGCLSPKNIAKNSNAPLKFKIYKSELIGITFQYPESWIKNGSEANVINRDGSIMSTIVNFLDTNSNSTLSVEYHVAPYGDELYKLEQEQFNLNTNSEKKNSKQVIVLEKNVYEVFNTISSDGKGNSINPPIKTARIVFLDKNLTGEYELMFKTPVNSNEIEIAKFNQLLASIKFSDQ